MSNNDEVIVNATVNHDLEHIHEKGSNILFCRRLRISGKLHRRRDRIKEFPKKFFGGLGTPEDSCVTLIEAYAGPRLPLDEEAKNLNHLMMKKNKQETDTGAGGDTATTSPSPNQKVRSTDQTLEPTTVARFADDEHSEPNSQARGGFSDTFEEMRAPSPLEEEICSLERLAEAGLYVSGPRTQPERDRDPLGLGEDESEPEGSSSSSFTLMASTQVTRNDPEDSMTVLPEEPVDEKISAGAVVLRTIHGTEDHKRAVPLIWNSPTWFLGFGLLFMSVLYAHLIYEMREMSRGLR